MLVMLLLLMLKVRERPGTVIPRDALDVVGVRGKVDVGDDGAHVQER